MTTRRHMQGTAAGIRRATPAEFLLLTERMARQARTNQAATVGNTILCAVAATVRGIRLLAAIVRDATLLSRHHAPARAGVASQKHSHHH